MRLFLLAFLFAPLAYAAEVDLNDCIQNGSGILTDEPELACVVDAPPPPPPPSGGQCIQAAPEVTRWNHDCVGWPGEGFSVKTGSGGARTNYALNNLRVSQTICLEAGSFPSDLSIGTSGSIYTIDSNANVTSLEVRGNQTEVRGQINGPIVVSGSDVIINGQCFNGSN